MTANIKDPLYFYTSFNSREELEAEIQKREEVSAYNKQNAETWYEDLSRFINRNLYQNTIDNARPKGKNKRKFEHTITLDNLEKMWEHNKGLCAATGVPMTWRKDDSPITRVTVDRIDSYRGYTLDNIWLVTSGFNTMKMEFHLSEVLKVFPYEKTTDTFKQILEEMRLGKRLTHNDHLLPTNIEATF
jgi:hypothetical protein